MELIYSALLLHSAKQPISEENVTKVLQASGASADAAKVKAMVAALEGVNIDDAISKAAMPAAGAPAEAGAEKKEENERRGHCGQSEQAAEGLAGLFVRILDFSITSRTLSSSRLV
jgi:large subunit ribosomal protein L12